MKITRRAKLLIIALVLCMTTMIGSTLAWFTDTVESDVNTIEAGNLDIEVQYSLDGSTWDDLDSANNLFKGSLWEPGHTEVVYLKITNAGNLTLKYKMNVNIANEVEGINVAGESFKLSEYLKFKATKAADEISTFDDRKAAIAAATAELGIENSLAAKTDTKTDTDYVALVIYMPETVGNEANHNGTNAPSITLGVNVVATQYPEEQDSFGSDYDAGAEYPSVSTWITTYEQLKAAVAKGGKLVLGADIELEGTLVLDGNYSTVLNMNGKKLTVKDGCVADPIFWQKNGSSLVITGNGTIQYDNLNANFFYPDNGSLTIENGNFIRACDPNFSQTIYPLFVGCDGSPVIINGGYFDGGFYSDGECYKNCAQNILNRSTNQPFFVYGGTFVGQNPAWGDQGEAAYCPDCNVDGSKCQGTFLEGQKVTDTELPAGYTITETTHEDGRPVFTVTYSK